ncbi:MerR family transcriptional regulator [Acidisoma cellulosilytica]|uniref:MerR family transcriptional regulator n=1 Tax=Acidisoma cellulosilyticum TaxID=2802395 RepID=A0A963Z6M5_9PROT|nr:MerR family transcriptional regulator [Acidisoma cellulosilyticum]MCB8882837.1 MerR family transcriptional regulator [Acidisoma cellulosilyticum]
MSAIPLPRDDDDHAGRAKPKKAPTAFRTISEVADDLHIPQHVLRFWETKFSQVKPLKRGGGRRYYRPDDVTLLRRIAHLLYTQGYTIKGVQRLLREGGGRLADDIPPPLLDDQDSEGETDSEALLSDHSPEEPVAEATVTVNLPLRFIPRSSQGTSAIATLPSALSAKDDEILRLRGALTEMLGQLEGLRALLMR